MEGGRFRSVLEARRAHGISGSGTVQVWVRRYGAGSIPPKKVKVETMKERDGLKEARRRIRELEAALVRAERRLQPRLRGRKLHVLLKGRLAEAGVKLGRDGLCKVLGRRGLLVAHLPRGPRTTMGTHSLPTFPNRSHDPVPDGRNQG